MIKCIRCGHVVVVTNWEERPNLPGDYPYMSGRAPCSVCHAAYYVHLEMVRDTDLTAEELARRTNLSSHAKQEKETK